MRSYRENPDGEENTQATKQNDREQFAAIMQAKRDAEHCDEYAPPLDLNHPDANMYGCFPCPACKSVYRYATQQFDTVVCDDCGLVQKLENCEN